MIKIDLITGFLGAGKTTFIRKYAQYLISRGMHIGIIENDFGAVNVDMLLLEDLEGDFCDVEPIVGGNVASDWKRRFKAKLIALAMQGTERVLVEPSGIYDVDTFFEVLYDEPVNRWYEIGDVITIVNAKMDERLSEQAEFLLMSQVANSGRILFSKQEYASVTDMETTEQYLAGLLKRYNCDENIHDKIVTKSWNDFEESDFVDLMNASWTSASYKRLQFNNDDIFTSLFFMNVVIPEKELKTRIQKLFHSDIFGTVFRVKGFFHNKEDQWIEINATKEHFEKKVIKNGQEVVIVIGENMQRSEIEACLNGC